MKRLLSTYWEYISYSGVKPGERLDEIRRIVLLNRICLLFGLVPIAGVYFFGEDFTFLERLIELVFGFFLVGVHILNRFLNPRFVRVFAFILGITDLITMTYYAGMGGGDILHLFPTLVAGIVIIDFKNKYERAVVIISVMVGTFLSIILLKNGYMNWDDGDSGQNRFLYNLVSGLIFTIIIVLYNFNLIEEQHTLLTKSAKEQASLNQELSSINLQLRKKEQEASEAKSKAEAANNSVTS